MKNKFREVIITDPQEVLAYFDQCISSPDKVDGIIIDTLTFLLDMYESKYVLGSSNTMKGWSNYQQFFKELMQDKVPSFNKPVIVMAHTRMDLDEKSMTYFTAVPVKGALKNTGVEAYFSTVVSTKKVSLTDPDLQKSVGKLLTITPRDERLGYKHVFQVQPTKTTVNERIRSPMGLFEDEQIYTNNDAHLLLNHLKEYYS